MAGPQRGRVVSGLFNFPGVGDGTTKFYGDFVGFDDSLTTGNKKRAGRQSTNKWNRVRPILASGKLVINFLVNTQGYALPDVWRGQEGSVTITYHSGKTKTVTVRVTDASFSLKKKDDTDVKGTLLCEVISNPTLTGFGGVQPTSTEPSASDEEQWGGTQKILDPNGLVTGAVRRIDVWGNLANTDAAEADRMATLIASNATPPLTYLKLRTASFQRDSDDGGEVIITYGLTTTEEDVINPAEQTTTDEQGLLKNASRAVFNGTPATPEGFIFRTETTREHNDQKILSIRVFGNRSPKDDHEYPGTVTHTDPLEMMGEATITLVTQSPDQPVGVVAPLGYLVDYAAEQLDRNPGNWKHVFRYAHINSHQRVTFPQDVFGDDPSDLEDFDRQATVTTSPTPPSAALFPTRIAGLKLRKVQTHRVGGLPALYLHVFEYGRRTTEEDHTLPRTVTKEDSSHLQDVATICQITATSAPPETPAAPLGQYVGRETVQLHDGTDTEKWSHTFTYKNNTTEEDLVFPLSVKQDDPSNLEDHDTRAVLTTSETPPSAALYPSRIAGLVLRFQKSTRRSGVPEKWLHVWHYTRTTTKQDIEFPATVTEADVSQMADQAAICRVTGSSSAGSAPPAPVGQHVRTDTVQLHAGTDGEAWKHVFRYANNTTEENVVFPIAQREDDPNNLEDTDTRAVVNSSSTAPAAADYPSRIAGLKLRFQKSVRKSGVPERWLHVWHYTRRTTVEDVTFPATVTYEDVSNLGDRATICIVNTSSAAGDAPAAPVGINVGRETVQLHDGSDGEAWKHVFHYGNTTNEQKIEFGGTVVEADLASLEDKATETIVTANATMPTGTTPTGTKHVGWTYKRIAGTPEKWEHTLIYGKRTSIEAREFDGSPEMVDPSGIADQKIYLLIQASETTSYPETPEGLKLRETTKRKIFDLDAGGEKWEHKIVYARTDRADDIVFDATWFESDVNALKSTAAIAVINAEETPPSVPGAPLAGTKWIGTRTKQIHNASGEERWVHVFKYGVRTPQEDIEWPKSRHRIDTQIIKSEAVVVKVTSDSTPPSSNSVNPDTTNLTLHWVETSRETSTQYIHVFFFKPFNSEEETEEGDSLRTADPVSFLIADDKRGIVSTTEAESAPAVSGMVCVRRVTKKISRSQWRHIFDYAFRSVADQLIADQRSDVYDEGLLGNRAVTAEVYSGAAPGTPVTPSSPTGLVMVEKEDRPTANPTYTLRIYRWGMATSAQKIEFDNTVAEAEAFGENVTRTATVVTSTDSAATHAANLYTASTITSPDSTFRKASAKKLNASRILQIIEQEGGDKLLIPGGQDALWDNVRGIPTGGYGSPNADIYCIPPGPPILIGGYTTALCLPVMILRGLSRFTIQRFFVVNETELFNKQFIAIKGHLNPSSFMGHDANEVMYLGADIKARFDVANTVKRLVKIHYDFKVDTSKHYIDKFLPLGEAPLRGGLLINGIGMVPHTYFQTHRGAAWPPQAASFDGFLA
jgi:hypothetical protein